MSTTSKMVTSRSSDGEYFVVDEAVALQSLTIKRMMEDNMRTVIHLPEVEGRALAKVIEHCKKRAESPVGGDYGRIEQELKAWDAEFFDVDFLTWRDIGQAAEHLEINSLCVLYAQTRETMAVRKTSCWVLGKVLWKVINMFDKVVRYYTNWGKPSGSVWWDAAWFLSICFAGFAAMLFVGVPMFKAFLYAFLFWFINMFDKVVRYYTKGRPSGSVWLDHAWFLSNFFARFAAMLFVGVPMFKAFLYGFLFWFVFVYYYGEFFWYLGGKIIEYFCYFAGMIKEWAADKTPVLESENTGLPLSDS